MKPMMNKKATTMKPMIKEEIGTAMMPTKIKNKNGVAMKPKTMQKIHANLGNAYSLLVQKAAGGVTCANIGTTATQIRAYHSRHTNRSRRYRRGRRGEPGQEESYSNLPTADRPQALHSGIGCCIVTQRPPGFSQ